MSQPVRLRREIPALQQAGRAVAIGAGLTALGGTGLYLVRYVVPGAATDWLVYVVGGGFSLVGVAMLVAGIRMLMMARQPEPTVDVDRARIAAGTPFRITVRQPGPVRLRSFRLNLTAEQVTTRVVWRRGRRERDRDRRLIHEQNVIDVGETTVARGEEFTHSAEATVPASVRLDEAEGAKTVVWRLEAWGKVLDGVDFGHPYVLDVRGVRTETQPSDAGSSPRRQDRARR